MSIKLKVLTLLGDGRFHSGQMLGNDLGVSRAAIWKAIQGLQKQFSLSIQSVPGRGYRLARPVELLDAKQLKEGLSPFSKALLNDIEVLPLLDSTNEYLRQAILGGASSGRVILAEQQSAGRGRRGHRWVSPFGANLYLSLAWRFDLSAMELSGLGIAVAVTLVKSLSKFAPGLGIKWPNDILWQDQKLAGILLEFQGEAHGPASVVIGVGINIAMPAESGQDIEQPWVDLSTIVGESMSRQQVAVTVIDELLQTMTAYQQYGLEPFSEQWHEWDLLNGQPLNVMLDNQIITGIGRGIDPGGAILVERNGKLSRYMAGEVRLRKQGLS